MKQMLYTVPIYKSKHFWGDMCYVCVCLCLCVCVFVCLFVCNLQMAPYSLNSILHNICSLGTNLCQLFFFLRSLVALTTLNPPPRQTLDYNRKQTNMAVHCPAKSGRICQDPGVSQRGDPCMFGPQKEIWITSTSAKSSGNVNWGPGLFKESISVCFWMEASSCSGLVQRQHRDEF